MYRPWQEDDRPVWRVTATWRTPRGQIDDEEQRLLLKTLKETGHVRSQVIDSVAHGRLTVTVSVKAISRDAAEHAAVRVIEVAHRASGLGELGLNLDRHAQFIPSPGGLASPM